MLLRKAATVVALTLSAIVGLSTLAAPAHADGYCIGAGEPGFYICFDNLPGPSDDPTPVNSPTRICYLLDCVEAGETLVSVPLGVSVPNIHIHDGTSVQDPTGCGDDANCIILVVYCPIADAVSPRVELPNRERYCT